MSFLARMWAYVSLGAMAFLVEEASPLFGGLAARDRHMHLSAVVIAVALGTWGTGLALYLLGRWRGHWLRKRYPRFRKLLLQSIALVRRHPWRAALAVRYAWGLRVPIPIACGIGRVPLYVFMIGTAISCFTWSLIFSLLGWWLGDATETLIGHVREWEPFIGTALVVAMIIGFVVVRRRRIPQRIERALDPESLPPAEEP